MKKVILKITFVALLGITIGVGSFSSNKNANIADLTLSNIEALAQSESTSYGTLYGNKEGAKFCCCPGGSRSCGSSKCSNC